MAKWEKERERKMKLMFHMLPSAKNASDRLSHSMSIAATSLRNHEQDKSPVIPPSARSPEQRI